MLVSTCASWRKLFALNFRPWKKAKSMCVSQPARHCVHIPPALSQSAHPVCIHCCLRNTRIHIWVHDASGTYASEKREKERDEGRPIWMIVQTHGSAGTRTRMSSFIELSPRRGKKRLAYAAVGTKRGDRRRRCLQNH